MNMPFYEAYLQIYAAENKNKAIENALDDVVNSIKDDKIIFLDKIDKLRNLVFESLQDG